MEYNKKIQEDIEILDPYVTKEEVLQYDHSNPFYIPMEGSSLRYAKTKFLAEEYKNVHILCLSDDTEISNTNKNKIKLFYQADSDPSELKGQANLVTLVRGPFALVHLKNIRAGLVVIQKDLLEYFNHDSNELADKELVYLMLEVKESKVRTWLKLYEEESTLDKFIEQKIFSSYYKLEDRRMDDYLLSLINQVGDFKYWQDKYNCSLSINNAFSDRKFNLTFSSKWNLPTEEIEKELQKLLQNFKENKTKITKNTNTNYPAQITNPKVEETEKKEDLTKMKTYVDGSKRDGHSFYGIVKPEELVIKRDTIEELLVNHSLSEQEKYNLICNLLLSKKYCHYVLNNQKILAANKDLLEKYKPVIRYLMGYAWISMYMEESIRKTRIKETDRFVFDIETASNLPVFPFNPQTPHLNPYFSCMVSDELLNNNQNIGGVKQSFDYQNGIVNLEEFRRRLNIFITGKAGVNLLEGADWSNMVVTGGCMPGIIPKTNPLMALFKRSSDPKIAMTEHELDRFFQEYYAKSDIDIACNHSNILDFIEHVKHLKTILLNNLGPNVKESEVEINPTKTLAIYINAKMLREKCERGEIPYRYEYILNNKNKRAVKFFFYELYLEQKKNANEKNRKILGEKINDDEYFEIIDYCECDKTVLIVNDHSFESEVVDNRTADSNSGIEMVYFLRDKDTVPTIEEEDFSEDESDKDETKTKSNTFIKFSETLKYKISSKHMKHPFEIFRISDVEFFSCIARFHLPCVRSYYNGTNCFILPSAITAYMTLTNIDFKYFVGSNDPISILNKYRMRGYGTLLNKVETNQYLSYVMATGNFKKAYNVTDTKDVKNIIGHLDVNHEFFKPRKNIPEDFNVDPSIKLDYQAVKMDYANNKDDIVRYYKKKYDKYSSEFVEKRTILPTGQIDPVKHWMIDASYDLLN
ncbi:hypothetical protein QJ856_gp0897 [Tupanvirus deep ocean]|uniref:Uncharacterized protein n=2 Tax=Tupanvirus TaxID=2094720 RepID=A0AC62A7U6_9VIRU|nr:hypothetical protein QJ856_gp0897 [Tupanvirus deep ocean]QKU33860.1 hypothetical protein [Tupanvirus deep ocean]